VCVFLLQARAEAAKDGNIAAGFAKIGAISPLLPQSFVEPIQSFFLVFSFGLSLQIFRCFHHWELFQAVFSALFPVRLFVYRGVHRRPWQRWLLRRKFTSKLPLLGIAGSILRDCF
jgi:hypothetical protein